MTKNDTESPIVPDATVIESANANHLRAALRAVLPFVCDEEGSPLCGVLLERDGQHWHVVATNGHVLARATLAWLGESSGRVESVFLPTASAKALASSLRGEKDPVRVEVRPDRFLVSRGLRGVADVPATDRGFPRYCAVIPAEGREASPRVGLNAAWLADAAAAFKTFAAAAPRAPRSKGFVTAVRVSLGRELDPVRLDASVPDVGDLTVVIMPRKL